MRGHDKNHIVIYVGHGDRSACKFWHVRIGKPRRAVGDGVDGPKVRSNGITVWDRKHWHMLENATSVTRVPFFSMVEKKYALAYA